MRQRWLVLTFSLCTSLLAATMAWPAVPVIEEVRIGAVLTSGYDIVTMAESEISVLVSDADGAADVYSVRVGSEEVIAGYVGPWDWVVEDPDRVRVTWWRTYPLDPGPADVIVTDFSAFQDTLSVVVPSPPSQAPEMSSPGPGYPVVTEPEPMLSWSNVEPGTTNSVTVSRAAGSYSMLYERGTGPEVWSFDLGAETSVRYNADGHALDPELQPGLRYDWLFASKRWVDDGMSDPRVHTYTLNETHGRFIAYSDQPVIERVDIERAHRAPLGDPDCYSQSVTVCATDVAGGGQFTSLTVAEPDGTTHSLMDPPALNYNLDGFGIKAVLNRLPADSAPGSYTIIADAGGRLATLVTPSAPAIPTLAADYPAPDAVIEDTTPIFSWHSGLQGTNSYIEVYVPDNSGWNEWAARGLTEERSAYDPAVARNPELTAGQTYLWQATSLATLDGSDYRTGITTQTCTVNRFTIYHASPPRPVLSGKLAYGLRIGEMGQGGIIGYDPDPHTINWLGPWQSVSPDWSPDGSVLAYSGGDGLTVDRLDGSEPVHLGVMPYCARWSPDGTKFVWSALASYPTVGVSVMNADGSNVQLLANESQRNGRPEWSPDGAWIAYCQQPGQDWQRLWLMRPDGSEKHPVLPTELVGYPGYQFTIGGFGQSWAPDSRRLVTSFVAEAEGEPEVWGLGVISLDGGAMTPIFATTEAICCAAPQFPVWSPEGTQIVFTSAHHLPVDPEWVYGKYELGSELWVINANGSGVAERLTYDCAVSGGPRGATPSWWASLRFSDVPKSQWAYCAINACAQAGIVHGYEDGTYQPGLVVTRDQMAAYISRALAGGEVPPGPAEPSFPADVPTTNWAYDYIEYAAAHGVVEGYDDTHYRPDLAVDRAQMAVYAARAQGWVGIDDDMTAARPLFLDVPAGFWSGTAIQACLDNGVVQGYDDGLYHPEIVVTRDQMAVYVARAFELPL
jgi:Tol biopolymer transport system component